MKLIINRFIVILLIFFVKICESYYSDNYNDTNELLPYIFYTETLPTNMKFMPTLANGHIGFTTFGDSIFMNGAYNGIHGLSHRARIPNYSNLSISIDNYRLPFKKSYSMNVQNGIFQIKYENSDLKIIQLIYPHRYFNRLIINQIYVNRLNAKGEIKIKIQQMPGNLPSEDVDFQSIQNITITRIKRKINQNYDSTYNMNAGDSSASLSAASSPSSTSTSPTNKQNYGNINKNNNYFVRRHHDIYNFMKSQEGVGQDPIEDNIYYNSNNNNNDNHDDDNIENGNMETLQFDGINSNNNNGANNDATTLLHLIRGFTTELEDENYQKSKKHICCVWNHVPEEITLNEEQQYVSYRFQMAVDELCSVAKQEMKDAFQYTSKSLIESNTEQWKNFWDKFTISVTGNLELAKTIYGSIFYLASSLPSFESNQPNNPYYGLSPTGVGRGGDNRAIDYQGHNFWDTEVWMLPTVTQFDTRWTRQLLNYRFRMLDIAKDNARKDGYEGAKFPWESAFTGTETVNPCCLEVAEFQHHITADIAWGMQNYFSVTYDIEWLHNEGLPLAENIANFWASRVKRDDTNGQYDIKDVMGPDEDHVNVTNNVYTNVIAGYALKFADFAKKLCSDTKITTQSEWLKIAHNLKILYNSTLDYHPQYEGYMVGEPIKQADTILLGYPLMFPMNDSTRHNDLRIYEEVTRKSGPAMTWVMHTINHMDIGNYDKAAELFNRSYKNYIRGPFQVWSEVIPERSGAVNFLTGAGGFLQSVINGYAGVRIYLDRMEIKRPKLPPGSVKFSISGIKYLGATFKITVTPNESLIQCISINPSQPLLLNELNNSDVYQITKNFIYYFKVPKVMIKSVRNNFKDWR